MQAPPAIAVVDLASFRVRSTITLPAPLASLILDALPTRDRPWTQPMRDAFINTFGHLLDYYYPVAEPDAGSTEADEADLRVTDPAK